MYYCWKLQYTVKCCSADEDYGIFVLPDSDNDNIQLVTDPSITSNYPSMSNEASCTDNCLFKRSKDDVSSIATTSDLYRDFTDTVAMWSLDSADRATGSTIVSLHLSCCMLVLHCNLHSNACTTYSDSFLTAYDAELECTPASAQRLCCLTLHGGTQKRV